MNKHFRHLSMILAVVMILSCSFTMAFADTTANNDAALFGGIEKSDVVVLFTNDVHAGITNMPILASYKSEMAKFAKDVILVDCGDAIQGEAIATLSKGELIVDLMNAVGYDYATPGNHEFDFSMEQFNKVRELQKLQYVCCDFMNLADNTPVLAPYAVKTIDGKKYAFIGVDTPESITKSTPTYFQDGNGAYIYGFCNDKTGKALYDQVQKTIDAVKAAETPDYIIGLFHCGVDASSSPWTSKEIINNTCGFNAVLDGHSHTEMGGDDLVKDKEGHEVILTQTGTKLANIGQLVIKADGTMKASLISCTDDYTKTDATVSKVLADVNAKNDALLSKVVAKTDVKLTVNGQDGKRAVRSYETNLGDLCADAYKTMLGADIGWVNGGGVRADIKVGDITYGDVIAVHPFGNEACLIEATGQQILDALEWANRGTPVEEIGGFLQVSGITFDVNTTIATPVVQDELKNFVKVDGTRRVFNVKVNGQAIDPKATYKLAAHNYMLKNGGDGFTMFKGDKVLLDCVMVDNEVLIRYISEKLGGTIPATYAKAQNRIHVSAPFADTYGTWAQQYVDAAYQNGVIKGMSDTSFGAKSNMTKDQFLTTLGRILGVAAPAEGEPWQSTYVAYAKEKGICETEGYDGNANITRIEMSTYIYNALKANDMLTKFEGWDAEKLNYTDIAKLDLTQQSALMVTQKAGYFAGYPDGTFAPDKTATRAEVSKVLVLLFNDLH